jgi:hypothetical protein
MWMALASHRTWLLGKAEKLLVALLRGWRPVHSWTPSKAIQFVNNGRRILNFTAERFIDRDKGVASTDPRRIAPECGAIFGKVDIYHTLQTCLIPTLPTTCSVTRGLLETNST